MSALAALLLTLYAANLAAGAILRVPQEWATIQQALSATQPQDTVLVAPGIYVESLVAPSHAFTLAGAARVDSAAVELAIIDPTELPGSDSLRTMTLHGSSAQFFDIVFRQRSAMTEGRPSSDPAGVVDDSAATSLSFSRCLFDSVHVGITWAPLIVLDSCRFIGSRGVCASSARPGKIVARNCVFDGATGTLITTRRGGLIENCQFVHSGTGYMLLGLGDSLVVNHCNFVGLDTLNSRAIWLRPRCGSEMRDCTIRNVAVRFDAIVQILDSCYIEEKNHDCVFRMSGVSFRNCGSADTLSLQGGEMIQVHCADGEEGYVAKFDSIDIDSTTRAQGVASGLFARASCSVNFLRFGQSLSRDVPQVYVNCDAGNDTVVFRSCMFDSDYFGLEREDNPDTRIIARRNWWGHASGPFHPELNPGGQGAQVDDDVFFSPWLASPPDSSDTNGVAVEIESPLMPQEYGLTAFPNPFNSTTNLQIEVDMPGDYQVGLFDLTGRTVRELFAGNLNRSHSLMIETGGLPSGLYFARLTNGSRTLAATKLLLLK